MIEMTDEMREWVDKALADGVPCVLGTASKDGHPQVSMKGSMMVFDGENLAYWERSRRTAMENVGENSNVVILYRNPRERVTWRFYGTATIYDSGTVREEIMGRTVQAELDRDPELKGVGVKVRVDKITDQLSGTVLQQRD